MFYPTLAKEILSYRIYASEAAAYNAKFFNNSGWRYPWESAYTGIDGKLIKNTSQRNIKKRIYIFLI